MRSAGVIGWPVAHSKSPLIHRFWLAKLGVDGDYGRFAVAPERLGDALRALPALGMAGVNVTVPHKVAALAHLDRIDDLAAKVGAVNTVVVEDGASVGHNTDVEGVREPLAALGRERRPYPNHVATYVQIIGAGGAARAAAVGAAAAGYGDFHVFARDVERAQPVAELAGTPFGTALPIVELDRPTFVYDPAYPDVKPNRGATQRYSYVVINATTLGMTGQPALAINLDDYPDDTIVYDLVYAPLETPLLRAARERGLRTIDGLAMLIGQAAAAFALFYGAAAPREQDAELRALLTRANP